MIDRLNAIYNGNGNVDSGVFVHVFDMNDNATHPWRPIHEKKPPIIDACVLNKRVPHIFISFGIRMGMVLSHAAIDRCTLCSWTHDAATDWRQCPPAATHKCVPGCINTHAPHFRKNMPQASAFTQTGIGPYAPNETSLMLRNRVLSNTTSPQGRHVDVVLSAPCYNNMLPQSVYAFLVPCKLIRKDEVFSYQATFTRSEFRRIPIVYYNDLVDPPFVAECPPPDH